MASRSSVLVKVRGDGRALVRAYAALGEAQVQRILTIPPTRDARALNASGSTWLRLSAAPSAHPWDVAHGMVAAPGARGLDAADAIEAAEPDLLQQWPYASDPVHEEPPANAEERCRFDAQNAGGGRAVGPGPAWHLGDEYSGLARAQQLVADKVRRVLIAHLDTGYDPRHPTVPIGLQRELQRNFVDPERSTDATDYTPEGENPLRNRGHGTATLSLLAGRRLERSPPGWEGYEGPIGGVTHARVVPIRIADWVVRLSTSTLVQGFGYARECGAHVLSMSMGGVSSRALVDAVNLAYEAGVVMVTAAGNNYASYPTPKSIVFPARYHRVLAACGVMADGRAYTGLGFGTMQGNYGPPSKMNTALAAYTPNVPWAQIGCDNVIDMDGAGTSAATPQIAAAVALWLAEHWDDLQAYPEPWMRVEAVRRALFASADRETVRMNAAETFATLGRGVLRADRALSHKPPPVGELVKLGPAEASWSWLNMIFGGGVSVTESYSRAQQDMFALELTQMAHRVADIEETIADPDRPAAEIPAAQRMRYLEAALDVGDPSDHLRRFLERVLHRPSVALAAPDSQRAAAPISRRATHPPAPKRRLRSYALDPSLGKSLDSLAVNETILPVPWDDVLPWEPDDPKRRLKPGPVGEYLEVVDVDPASNRMYEPVDLNNLALLAQDGWPPSEGNPQFHQQMVYAVGMTTIGHFERALGRRALWAPHEKGTVEGPRESEYVPRLRIYPHAFRGSNAYYSPAKKALLFGYFPAESRGRSATSAGTMVFSCLSSDIIAHEMTHALLDGLHRRFEDASNPDVPAFHEAFADIVALFQHFTITELVRFEIARSRGDLSAEGLLAGLAKQFGEGSSRGGPLRHYRDQRVAALQYDDTDEPHARGSILVYAVYEAFLAIVARRTSDLIRIATGGTGVLASGALHPDLVNRITQETCEAARDVLQMCIRALDYCPSVDITFGEYLRAIVTADRDLLPEDSDGRRVAFMEAFRNRGILPRDVRTVSEETLAWSTLDIDSFGPEGQTWAGWLLELLDDKGVGLEWDLETDRRKSFEQGEANRWKMWQALHRLFRRDPRFFAQFGLIRDLPRFNRDGDPLPPRDAEATTFAVSSVRPARRIKPNGSFQTDLIAVIEQRRPEYVNGIDKAKGWFWFRGGATLILDPREKRVRYLIVKNMTSTTRLERQRRTASAASGSALRALYFGDSAQFEPFAMIHSDLAEQTAPGY